MTDPTDSINRRVALQLMAAAGAAASSATSFAETKINKAAQLKGQSMDIKPTSTRFNLQETKRVIGIYIRIRLESLHRDENFCTTMQHH